MVTANTLFMVYINVTLDAKYKKKKDRWQNLDDNSSQDGNDVEYFSQ